MYIEYIFIFTKLPIKAVSTKLVHNSLRIRNKIEICVDNVFLIQSKSIQIYNRLSNTYLFDV